MIKKILYDISVAFFKDEEKQRLYRQYQAMTEHQGWKVHQGMIVEVANRISAYMLTEQFTRLDKEEKDAQQRAFFIAKEIIEFLFDPLKGADKYAKILTLYKDMEATLKGKRPEKSRR